MLFECHTQGETLEEARAMAQEAIGGYLEALQKSGRPMTVEEFLGLP